MSMVDHWCQMSRVTSTELRKNEFVRICLTQKEMEAQQS